MSIQEYPSRRGIHWLALFGKDIDTVVRQIETGGNDVNEQGPGGNTPLHYAAGRGNLDVARGLVRRGARAGARNARGETPVHVAAHYNRGSVIEYLVHNGAQVNVADLGGDTPLHHAARAKGTSGHDHAALVLIRNGANVNATNVDGKTPLRIALEHGRRDAARVLRQNGARA